MKKNKDYNKLYKSQKKKIKIKRIKLININNN